MGIFIANIFKFKSIKFHSGKSFRMIAGFIFLWVSCCCNL